MPAQFGFGVGVGDIIAVIKLISRITNALHETSGASANFQALQSGLKSLSNSLTTVHTILHDLNEECTRTETSLDLAPLNGVAAEFKICKKLLEDFAKSCERFTAYLSTGQKSHSVRCLSAKIVWALSKNGDVERLQREIEPHIVAFNLYARAIPSQNQARIEMKLVSVHQMTCEINSTLAKLWLHLTTMPKMVGFPGSGGDVSEHVFVDDALGKPFPLPLFLCTKMDRFQEILELKFRDLPGENRITRRHYLLSCHGNQRQLERRNWDDHIVPGTTVEVTFVVGTWQNMYHTSCYRCDSKGIGMNNDGWRRCSNCSLQYNHITSNDLEYSPIDGFFTGKGNEDRRKYETQYVDKNNHHLPPWTEVFDQLAEESLLQRVSIVFEPIWNITYRSFICRCILWEVQEKSRAPRLDIERAWVCPRHCRGEHPGSLIVPNENPCEDPYFNKYGGYDVFKMWVYLNDFALSVLNDSFFGETECLRKEDFDHAFENLTEENLVALKAYDTEVETMSKELEAEGKINRISSE